MDTTCTDGQLLKLLQTMRQKGMTPGRFTKLVNSGILADVLDPKANLTNRESIRAALGLDTAAPEVFRLTVDYNMTIEEMFAAGNFQRGNGHAHRFVVEGFGVQEFEGRYFRPEHHEPLYQREEWGIQVDDGKETWLPSKIEHLLALAAKFPTEQMRMKIGAPASRLKPSENRGGYGYCPVLSRDRSHRLISLEDRWTTYTNLLYVRKIAA